MRVSPRQLEYLELMGIDVWQLREGSAPAGESAAAPQLTGAVPQEGDAAWEALRREVAVCEKCQLHQGRTQAVFGTGNPGARWMLIGEAPGAEEDRQGKPFVGRAGQLLTNMLGAIGLEREEVFIANILKCRPPDNRDPRPEEVAACGDFLRRQIVHVRPRIILALGRVAAQNLLQVDAPLGRLRGKVHEYPDLKIPVVVTYHPAYLLRSPLEKRKSWQDLKAAVKLFSEIRA